MRHTTTSGRPYSCAPCIGLGSTALSFSRAAWWCTAKDAIGAPTTVSYDRAHGVGSIFEAGLFEPPCERCGLKVTPEAVTEGDRLDPRSVYAATKVHQEHLCGVYAREMGSPFAALRYHNVYGSRMPAETPYAGVASIFRSALERGERPEVFEDGLQLRDFVHVKDVARANVLAIESHARGAFNIASGSRRTILEMADALSRAAGTGAEPVVSGRHRAGDVRHVIASPERARRELGFALRLASPRASRTSVRPPFEFRLHHVRTVRHVEAGARGGDDEQRPEPPIVRKWVSSSLPHETELAIRRASALGRAVSSRSVMSPLLQSTTLPVTRSRRSPAPVTTSSSWAPVSQ